MDASFLEVDVAAIRRNYRRLRDLVGPQTRICPVIKGNAYGMGATEVGRVLQQAGASMLAVYDANEALEVLDAGVRCPILVLGPDPCY
ncbi:MAG: alanine racemase, partial [Phycisphaerales bacterium]